MRFSITTGWLKFLIGWVAVFLFRLIPFRPPNVEPMLATVMPFSKRYGWFGSFLFAFLGIVLYDAVTSGWGSWTWVTAMCYGLVGVAAHFFFQQRDATRANFLIFGIPATIVYDAITMWLGPLSGHQTVLEASIGQIPFTLLHLLGTVVFAVILSPVLYRWVVLNESLELSILWQRAVAALRA